MVGKRRCAKILPHIRKCINHLETRAQDVLLENCQLQLGTFRMIQKICLWNTATYFHEISKKISSEISQEISPKKLPKKSQHMKNVSKMSWKKSSNCRYSFQHSCFCLPPTLKNNGDNIFFLISFVLRFDQMKKVTNIAEKTKDWLLVGGVSFSKIFISHSILFI